MNSWTCKKCGETFDLFDYETGTELSDVMKEHVQDCKEKHKVI